MRLRTLDDFTAIACHTPHDAPVGLTHREILDLESLLKFRLAPHITVCGRRIVAIPYDWETNW